DQGNYPRSLAPDARDLYGRSKQVGELLQAPHLTLRTSIVGFEFGEGTGLLSWLLTQQGEIRGYRKAIFSGLPTAVLARTIFDLIRSPQPLSGVWHVASDPIDKFDLTS